ncbi:MAG: acylphosphatase [Alphaproteobacteria bacterium]|nr:acylphosphatase [Alphaproteobacteria bacterium]
MSTTQIERTVHVRIAGHVQGVGLRAYIQDNARKLGLSGWVTNCHDRTVEALFHGAPAAVEAMLVRARMGPPAAHVGSLTILEDGDAVPPAGFHILKTL